MAVGMAAAFVNADRQSPTSRVLAVAFTLMGVAYGLGVPIQEPWRTSGVVPPYGGLWGVVETLSMMAFLEWMLRVRRTVPAGNLDVRPGDYMLRLGQGAAVLYGVLSLLFPATRVSVFISGLEHPENLSTTDFWLFAGPVLMVLLSGGMSLQLLLNRRPDHAEQVRAIGMLCAAPFFIATFVLPLGYGALSMLLGEAVFLIGMVDYHVLQGQRAQFLSRFLSPQVAKLVAERGLSTAMQPLSADITVVCCDLRGFMRYAGAHPSARVLEVLREYYDAVGEVVAEYGATIKDFAGDGILILVGAPLPIPQHARVGLEMARRIRVVGTRLTAQWSAGEQALGIGVGVASGPVTVGVIGSASRLEYTAVGLAVNLASRLCEQAAHGEILVGAHTRALASAEQLEQREPLRIEGIAEPVIHYAAP